MFFSSGCETYGSSAKITPNTSTVYCDFQFGLVDDLVPEFEPSGHTVHGVRRTADRVHAQELHFVEIIEVGRNEPELRRPVIEPDGEGLLRRRHVEVLGGKRFLLEAHRRAVVVDRNSRFGVYCNNIFRWQPPRLMLSLCRIWPRRRNSDTHVNAADIADGVVHKVAELIVVFGKAHRAGWLNCVK